MAPIKIGFIGLSSSQSWAVWSHLPYLKNNNKYEIVALCNSTKEAAQAAIKTHGLSPKVKAYGNPSDLAADPDVELVVVSTRVDKHYEGVMPALRAGKDVFCEWPLAKNEAEAKEMLALAKKKGVRTLVGLQATQNPIVKKLHELLGSGKIGKLLSTTFNGTAIFAGATEMESQAYQNDINNGANLLTIYAMHSLEAIITAIAPLSAYTPLLATNHSQIQLTTSNGTPTKTISRTSPDQVLLHGTFSCGALFSYHIHGGPAPIFSNSTDSRPSGLTWRLFGTAGEIQVSGPHIWLNASEDGFVIEVFQHETGKTEIVEPRKDGFSRGLGDFSRNVARLYEGFAEDKGVEAGVLDWGVAVERMEFVDEVYKRAGVKVEQG